MIPTDFLCALWENNREMGSGGGSHLPCRMISGSVIISCSPPSGTRHTRILASSPACWVEMEMCTSSHSSSLQKTQNKNTGQHMRHRLPTARRYVSKGSQEKSTTLTEFWMVGSDVSGSLPG